MLGNGDKQQRSDFVDALVVAGEQVLISGLCKQVRYVFVKGGNVLECLRVYLISRKVDDLDVREWLKRGKMLFYG